MSENNENNIRNRVLPHFSSVPGPSISAEEVAKGLGASTVDVDSSLSSLLAAFGYSASLSLLKGAVGGVVSSTGGRPSVAGATARLRVPITPKLEAALTAIAEAIGGQLGRSITPAQCAYVLLDRALATALFEESDTKSESLAEASAPQFINHEAVSDRNQNWVWVSESGLRASLSLLRRISPSGEPDSFYGALLPALVEGGNGVAVDRAKRPHLFLTRIRHESWPFMFRATLRLRDQPGALSKALRCFQAAGANLRDVRVRVAGHSHGNAELVGELTPLREEFAILASEQHSFEARTQFAKVLAVKSLLQLKQLQADMLECDRDSINGGFLYEPFREGRVCTFSNDDLQEEARRFGSSVEEFAEFEATAVQVQIATDLFHAWRFALDGSSFTFQRTPAQSAKKHVTYIVDNPDCLARTFDRHGFDYPCHHRANLGPNTSHVRIGIQNQYFNMSREYRAVRAELPEGVAALPEIDE